ncbi:Uncharacterized protein APZ42_010453, partial [Daphnia magna]
TTGLVAALKSISVSGSESKPLAVSTDSPRLSASSVKWSGTLDSSRSGCNRRLGSLGQLGSRGLVLFGIG